MSLLGLGNHASMLADELRNRALARAVDAMVRQGDVVADVGGGTGLLSLLAARAGASKVYCIENTALAGLAKRCVRENGAENTVEVIAGLSQDLSLPERCDVVISETLGFLAFDEGFRSVIVDARERFMRPGGRLAPAAVRLCVAAVSSDADVPQAPHFPDTRDLDFSSAIRVLGRIPRRVLVSPESYSSTQGVALELDCHKMEADGLLQAECTLVSRCDGVLAGFVIWFEADLFGGIMLSSQSARNTNHWGQGFLQATESTTVRKGDRINFAATIADRPGAFRIDWSHEVDVAQHKVSAA